MSQSVGGPGTLRILLTVTCIPAQVTDPTHTFRAFTVRKAQNDPTLYYRSETGNDEQLDLPWAMHYTVVVEPLVFVEGV